MPAKTCDTSGGGPKSLYFKNLQPKIFASNPMKPFDAPEKKNRGRFSRKHRVLVVGFLVVAGLVGVVVFALSLWLTGRRDAYDAVDLDHVFNCVTRANSSYHEPHIIRNEFGSHVEICDFPVSGVRVFIESKPGEDSQQWIVLRGTENLANVIADLKFVEREDHELGVRIHRGFDDATRECLPWVIEKIDRSRPICLTGHSLGGSMAIIMAAILDVRGYEEVSVVTFGQPKITDFEGAESLKHLDILRVVFESDPIPLLPPVLVPDQSLDTYHHFGPEIVLQEDGHFFYLNEHDTERLNVMDFWSRLTRAQPKNHILGNSYIPSLRMAMERFGQTPAE